MANNFITHLISVFLRSANNNYTDNYDYYRYGILPSSPKTNYSLKTFLNNTLNKKKYFNKFDTVRLAESVEKIDFPFSEFEFLYNNLEDADSKDLLIKIIAYRVLGHTKIKLPLNTPKYWNDLKKIEEKSTENKNIELANGVNLPLHDLAYMDVPIKIYNTSFGINIDFVIRQYELKKSNMIIKAEKGDFVIDGGGCYGDTALYFAHEVGSLGKVFVYEFIPENLQMMRKNLSLNPDLESRVEIVERPIWDSTNKEVFYFADGPASIMSFDKFDNYSGKTTTLSIDDMLQEYNIPKIDFIKMDIEGAELQGLRGAKNVLAKFKPKLAIALYHDPVDFNEIPKFLESLNLDYKFYITHSTINQEETMLFAIVN